MSVKSGSECGDLWKCCCVGEEWWCGDLLKCCCVGEEWWCGDLLTCCVG